MMRAVGKELGIPGAHLYRLYADPFGNADIDCHQIKTDFFNLYTTKNIYESWIRQKLQTELGFRNSFIDWCKEQTPLTWRKEHLDIVRNTVTSMMEKKALREEILEFLKKNDIIVGKNMSYEQAIESERVSSYCEAKVYTKTGQLRIWPVYALLLELKVLEVAKEREEPPQETLTQQFSKTVSSFMEYFGIRA